MSLSRQMLFSSTVLLGVAVTLGCQSGHTGTEEKPAVSSSVNTEKPMDLEQHRWKNRLILLFASGENDQAVEEQKRLLEAEKSAVDERDLLVFVFNSGDGESLRERYAVDEEKTTLLLVGKDGGVKLREAAPIEPNLIFALIDTMPMRQSEMRQNN